jgi:hypothetical protein
MQIPGRFQLEAKRVGDPGVTRTRNISLRRRMLYPVELRDHDSNDSGSENGSQYAVTFLTICLYVVIQPN